MRICFLDSESLSVESAEDALAGIGGSSQPSSPTHPSAQRLEHDMVPSVFVSPSVYQEHSLLQFSEVTPVCQATKH